MPVVYKINLKVFVTLVLFLLTSLFAQAVLSSSWQGKWDSSKKRLENPVVYYYYELKPASEGFNWRSIKRDVPYGPNEQVQVGRADFVSKTQAVDYDNKLTFDLSYATSGARVLTVLSQEPDPIAETFYFVPVFFKAGFDCNKASIVIEKAICTDKRIALADVEINQQYRAARKKLTGTEQKSLKTSQRGWIKQRNRCKASGEADMACLALSYAHRLAKLQKINNPAFGSGEGVNSTYLQGLQKTKAAISSNVPLLLVVASEQREWAVELMKHNADYNVDQLGSETVLSASYSYNSVCWPADCIISVVLDVSIDGAGNIKVARNQQSKNLE